MWTDRQRSIICRVSLQMLGKLNLQVYLIGRLFPAVLTSVVCNKHVSCRFHRTCYPSLGVHKTVTTASGTGYIFVQLPPYDTAKLAWPLRREVAWSCWRGVVAQKWPVPEAIVTVLCTPDDGCDWHPKPVEWTCRIINRLLCVASRWTIINIDQRCTEP